ncbi:MAG: transposase [Deltaproteobacteria bacterium]|nr:transposase [Deltaproteobacteria bacterium]
MATLVPEILLAYLSLFRPHFTKPSFTFFSSYILSLLLSGGRKTMSRVAHTCFWVDRHLASWERFLSQNRWDTTALFGTLLDTLHAKLADSLKIHGAYLAVVDTLLIAKNGHKMPGVQFWKDHSGNADRGEHLRGHHWAILGLIAFSQQWGRFLCLPLLMQLISGQLNPFMFAVDPQGVATLATIWDSILPLIFQLHLYLNQAALRVVVDAYFAKAPFINPLLRKGIHVVGRLRKDSVGWDDPTPEQRSDAKRGRKWKLAQLLTALPARLVLVHLYGKVITVRAVCRVVWLREVSQKVKVVVVEGLEEPIILFSTDLTLSMAQIIEIFGARFTIELAIRDLKGHFGLADYQCYLAAAIHRFVHLACLAFCLYRLLQLDKATADWLPPAPKGVSPASFAHLRQGLRRYLLGRILSAKSGEIPNLEDTQSELEAILRIAA